MKNIETKNIQSHSRNTVLSAVQCEQGYMGDCCCNCKFQVKINKHPINPDFAKGSISETFGYGCEVFRFLKDGSNDNQIIFSENIHGMCEMHSR